MDNDIFLSCAHCRRAFYIQDLTDDEDDIPNPTFCPFCGKTSGLSELDDIDEADPQTQKRRLTISDPAPRPPETPMPEGSGEPVLHPSATHPDERRFSYGVRSTSLSTVPQADSIPGAMQPRHNIEAQKGRQEKK